jgi:hypothetical protein
MEQSSSWQPKIRPASQEISRLLWDPNVHYRVHKIPQVVSNLSLVNPIHIPILYFKIHFNITFPFK